MNFHYSRVAPPQREDRAESGAVVFVYIWRCSGASGFPRDQLQRVIYLFSPPPPSLCRW